MIQNTTDSKSYLDLLESLDEWIDDAIKNSKPIGPTLSRARTTIANQHDRIDELLNALECQNAILQNALKSALLRCNHGHDDKQDHCLCWECENDRKALDSPANDTILPQ